MGRKPKYTEKAFRLAYKQVHSVKELATLLQMSAPSVRNNLHKYSLRTFDAPLKRREKFSYQIARAYKAGITLVQLALKFKCSPAGIRAHLLKFVYNPNKYRLYPKLPKPTTIQDIPRLHRLFNDLQKLPKRRAYANYRNSDTSLCYEVARSYVYDVTIPELAKKYNISIRKVSKYLSLFITDPDSYSLNKNTAVPKLPKPRKLGHLQIINLLILEPNLLHKPTRLLAYPGMTRKLVTDYYTKGKRTLEEYEKYA